MSKNTIVPFLDLKLINTNHSALLQSSFNDVLNSGWYIKGEKVAQFEKEFSDYIGLAHCIGVGNGLDALSLSLKTWLELDYIQGGSEVIVPANTYIASILAISSLNLKPVLVEPDPISRNIHVDHLSKAITEKTSVIMPVHLYGNPCDMDLIEEISKNNNILVLEDCAQAHGATFNGRKVGSFGHASAFSFYPGKNLGALGDGGCVITNDEKFASELRAIANYGSHKKYVNKYKGVNSRLDELQAGILLERLKFLDAENNQRIELANMYSAELAGLPLALPQIRNSSRSVFHLYVILVEDRDSLALFLNQRGIETMIHYPIPPHLQECYSEMNEYSFPITENIAKNCLSLPLYPYMDHQNHKYVCDTIKNYYK